MKITPKEAAQIMGNHEMECSSCPVSNDIGNCQTTDACADVALQAGKVILEETEQDAFDMADLFFKWLSSVRLSMEAEKWIGLREETSRVRKKYEDHR